MGGMANASEDRPWHDGVPVRMQRQPKVPAGQRKPPAAAPMNPEVASSTSVGSGRNSLNRAAPARKAKTDSNTKKGEEDPVTRQMIDKRQSRRDNGPSFTAVIEKYRTGESDIGARLDKGLKKKETGGLLPKDDGLGVPVFVRKRPLFAHEVKKKDYDVVTVDTNNCVVVHNCQMHADLKRMHILHRAFPCTATFSELSTSSEVYSVAAAPLVTAAAYGGQAALFMYGQTGSGKTYTMSTIEKDGLRHLYGELESQGPCTEVRIAVFEISGKKCYDLLQQGHREIFLKETESGAVELLGADEPPAQTADDAFELLAEAKTRRATASTTANATSSRSHCVIRISTLGPSGRGQLTLVDCAGSERNNDSMYHDAQARKEGAEINASLYALRECIRLRRRQSEEARHSGGGKHVHVPYRSSQLTRVLMECFTSPAAQVAVIATVSPSATDTEHTISTLQTALMMAGASSDAYAEVKEDVPLGGAHKPSEVREVKPINWSSKDVRSWLGNLRRGAFKYFAESLPPDINGRALVRMNKAALAQVCAGGNHESGTIIFNEIRNEIDRVDKVLRQQRKGVVDANTRRKSGW
uniref:Kinesin motor domain n=1 Tax=Tetraselmis sp. GSL018 TaxID=582737 RepID=A0A061RIY0_9CHLO